MRLRLPGRARHVAFILAVSGALGLAVGSRVRVDSTGDRAAALAHALKKRGIEVSPQDIQWMDRPGSLLGSDVRAVVRASPSATEAADIFLVDTKLSPEGVLLAVDDVYNVAETSGADESRPVIRGNRIAYVSRPALAEVAATVHVLDLAGQPELALDWTRLEKIQHAITNAQQTGQLRGIGRHTFALEVEAKAKGDAGDDKPDEGEKATTFTRDVTVELESETLVIRVAGQVARVGLDKKRAALARWIREADQEIARPSDLVQWAVDRVRAVPWIGDDRMQTIKAIAFTAKDFVERNKENVTGDTGEADIARDLGASEHDPPTRAMPVDPEIGWPPPPLEPWIIPALPGEGQWNSLDKDPFVRKNEGLPPAFLTTFIRGDKERKATRVYIALWDPRQVELHMMAGTVEPKGATGEAGPGLIPRTPEVMRRVVAASNAGFQALHGEFGMMADGVVYLPPKPYAATVAVLRDGSTAFGTWPADTSIPEPILSYRQNMTVMVQDEKFNPFNRTWWGGTPPGWADKTHTVRTGIGLTKEHFIAYFYGTDVSPEALAQAMIQARCVFGIALDMNAGHSGLEFYKVAPAEEFQPLGRPLQNDWESEGDVAGLDGWKFRTRRLIRGMGLMHFPRYIKREARDYFYMTLRHMLPGAALSPAVQPPSPNEGEWRVKGLPQHGFPYALALTELRPDAAHAGTRVRVLKIDPRTVSTAKGGGNAAAKTVAVIDAGEAPQKGQGSVVSLWHSAAAFSIAAAPPVPDAVRVASGPSAGAMGAVAALGINDEDGMLIYAEVPGLAVAAPAASASAAPAAASAAYTPPPVDPVTMGPQAAPNPGPLRDPSHGKVLDQLLKQLGCTSRIFLAQPLSIALGGDTELTGAAVRAPAGPSAVRFLRVEAASAKRIFQDTPIVPFSTWYPLQQQRIRYFKKPRAEAAEAPGGDEHK